MIGRTRIGKWFTTFWFVAVGQLYEIRMMWFWYVVQVSITPLVLLLFFGFVIKQDDPNWLAYVISGNLTQAMTVSTMVSLGQEIGGMKDHKVYEYYAALPVTKSAFVSALITRAMIFALPSLVIISVLGVAMFHLNLQFSPLILPMVILSAYALAGVGAVIGFYSPNGRVASLMTQFITPLVLYLAPVYAPVANLPRVLRWTSNAIPTSHIARLFREFLTGQAGDQSWLSAAVVACYAAVSIWMVSTRLDWRAGGGS